MAAASFFGINVRNSRRLTTVNVVPKRYSGQQETASKNNCHKNGKIYVLLNDF